MIRVAVFMPIIITAKYVKTEFELRGLAFLAVLLVVLLNAHLRSGRRQMSETSGRLLRRG